MCVVPGCRIIIQKKSLMCSDHWLLVPQHLQEAQQVAGKAWRRGRPEGQKWWEFSYECIRTILLHTWLDAFTLPTAADYARMPKENPHLRASERCWCPQCVDRRVSEGEPPCGCTLCLTVAYIASKALQDRRYVRVDQLSTGGDWRAPA